MGKFLFKTPIGEMQRVEIDPRVGDAYCIVERCNGVDGCAYGQVSRSLKDPGLVFTLEDTIGFRDTVVTIEIVPKASGCELMLMHKGVSQEYKDKVGGGWMMILSRLADATGA